MSLLNFKAKTNKFNLSNFIFHVRDMYQYERKHILIFCFSVFIIWSIYSQISRNLIWWIWFDYLFTWWNKHTLSPIVKNLDCILVNEEWMV